MDIYEIIITPDASVDMIELKNYIANTLKAPDTALKYIHGLRKEIKKLETFPAAFSPIDDEPWHSRGTRRIIHKNFFIYYRIDNKEKRVYILDVVYAKRNQLTTLLNYE